MKSISNVSQWVSVYTYSDFDSQTQYMKTKAKFPRVIAVICGQ